MVAGVQVPEGDERAMSCYFNQLKSVFREATVIVDQDNEEDIAVFLADLVRTPHGDCPATWKALRPWVEEPRMRAIVVEALREEFGQQ